MGRIASDRGPDHELRAAFAKDTARLGSVLRLPLVALMALIGTVVDDEPHLDYNRFAVVLVVYAVWSVVLLIWAWRLPVPAWYAWLATGSDLCALVALVGFAGGGTSSLQPFFLVQPIVVVLQLRPALTATVGFLIAGGYAAIWSRNLGINNGPGVPGVVWLHFGLLVWVAVATTAVTMLLVRRSRQILALVGTQQRLIADSMSIENRERARLAEELHDGPLQNLIAARRNLEDLNEIAPEHPLLAQSDGLLRTSAAALRGTMTVLHPQVLDEIGLAAALEELIRRRSNLNLTIHLNAEPPNGATNKVPHQTMLYSVARELLTNIEKHAQATQAWVGIERRHDAVRLTVQDNGQGMPIDRGRATAADGHFGLTTCQLRVADAGGTLTITPAPGNGTLVTVELPTHTP